MNGGGPRAWEYSEDLRFYLGFPSIGFERSSLTDRFEGHNLVSTSAPPTMHLILIMWMPNYAKAKDGN